MHAPRAPLECRISRPAVSCRTRNHGHMVSSHAAVVAAPSFAALKLKVVHECARLITFSQPTRDATLYKRRYISTGLAIRADSAEPAWVRERGSEAARRRGGERGSVAAR